jgi:hypothetical protein
VNVELAVRSHLAQDIGVTTLVSTRIYQVRLPQSPTLPALRVQLISEPHNHHLRGPDGAARARVQIDSYVSDAISDPYGSIDAIGSAIRSALDGAVFTVDDFAVTGSLCVHRLVMYEADDLRLWREVQDYIVWTRTA